MCIVYFRHYGGSCSLENRLSAAVLQKNEGYSYLSNVKYHIVSSFILFIPPANCLRGI